MMAFAASVRSRCALLHRMGIIAALAIIYYLAAKLGLSFAFASTNVSPVWPPSGVALAALLIFGWRIWPGITLGAFAANLLGFLDAHVLSLQMATWTAASIATGNTLEALTAAWLVQWVRRSSPTLVKPVNIIKFALVALVAASISALIGTGSLIGAQVIPWTVSPTILLTWWLGDIGGFLLLTPFLLACANWRQQPLNRRMLAATGATLFLALITSYWIFNTSTIAEWARPACYILILCLAAGAYCGGWLGGSLITLISAGMAVWGTVHGLGPFARESAQTSLVSLDIFIILCSLVGLVLAADRMERRETTGKQIIRQIWMPWLALLLSLGITILAWQLVSLSTTQQAYHAFRMQADDIRARLIDRLRDYEQTLQGTLGLFAASQEVEREEFRAYVNQIDIERNYPGIQGIGYAQWLAPQELSAHEEIIRSQGFVNYKIHPPGPRPAYSSIVYLEPFNGRNLRAFGYDMLSESVRRQAMLIARDSGQTIISGRVTLVQEDSQHPQAGFLMYLPLYHRNLPISTLDERRVALQGYIYSPFRVNNFMAGVLGQIPPINIRIYDGPQPSPAALMYDYFEVFGLPAITLPLFETTLHAPIQGHEWTLQFFSAPGYETAIDRQKEQLILITGMLVSLLFFAMARTLGKTRDHAQALANSMTTALRESETKFRSLAESAGAAILIADAKGQLLSWNQSASEMFAYSPVAIAQTNLYQLIPAVQQAACPAPSPPQATGTSATSPINHCTPCVQQRLSSAHDIIGHTAEGRTFPAEVSLSSWETDAGRFYGAIITDISTRRRTEEALRASEKRFRNMLENAPIGMALVSLEGKWLDVNDALCHIIGYTKAELRGMTFQDITHPEDLDADLAQVQRLMRGEIRYYQMAKRYYRKGGSQVWVMLTASLQRDESGAPQYFISQIEDINERKLAEQQLAQLAHYDPLTGLANRTLLRQEIERRIARGPEQGFAVVFVDLDHFKQVNDSLGHEAGDQLLQEVATLLNTAASPSDCVARLGGDEFVLVLDTTVPAELIQIIDRIRHQLARPLWLHGQRTVITLSFGISLFPQDGQDVRHLFRSADSALYHAKAEGRNNLQFYLPELNTRAGERLKLRNDLRQAIEQDQLELHYQPIVSLKNGVVEGAEALLRWPHPEHHSIAPDELILLAEDTGLITLLGEWVMRTACQEATRWQTVSPGLQVAVNLSVKQFKPGNLVTMIKHALADSQLPAHCLCVEITEQLLLHNTEHNLSQLAELKRMGIKVAIDDFGVGYSSLSYLKRFDPTKLKIDRSFILDLHDNKDSAAIVKAVIAMAHRLKIQIVAEGIETLAQQSFLEKAGCDAAQGYFYAKPSQANDFRDWLAAQLSDQPLPG